MRLSCHDSSGPDQAAMRKKNLWICLAKGLRLYGNYKFIRKALNEYSAKMSGGSYEQLLTIFIKKWPVIIPTTICTHYYHIVLIESELIHTWRHLKALSSQIKVESLKTLEQIIRSIVPGIDRQIRNEMSDCTNLTKRIFEFPIRGK